jgi:outer membrane protein assembly factor BamD (BamD/ComL family)
MKRRETGGNRGADRIPSVLVMASVVLVALSCTRGHQQAQLLARMTAENQVLKDRVDSLEHVVVALRDAPENIYSEAMALLASNRLREAKTKFESLVLGYPASPLAANAREQLAKLGSSAIRVGNNQSP